MWERVADRFNANRTRGTPERDWESLRRKFRNLYGKPKLTGRNSTPRENDETFEQTVDEATANEEQRGAVVAEQGLVAETNGGLEELGQRFAHENYAPDSDRESAGRGEEAANTEHHDGIPAGVRGSADDAENGDPPDTLAERPQGSIFTRDGVVDAALAAEFDLSQFSPDEDDEESSQPAQQRHLQSDGGSERDRTEGLQDTDSGAQVSVSLATDATQTRRGQTPHATSTRTARSPSSRLTQRTTVTTASPAASSTSARVPRSVGRPRGSRRDLLDTVVTPDGPILQRDPARAQADALELEAHPSLNIGTNRLGGRDIRVMRDNLATMSESGANATGKRSPASDATRDATASYGKNKRIRAKARLEELKQDIEALGKEQFSAGADMMQMLVIFQKDSDRRTEAEERRRREEREERREADRLEREERERIRNEVAEAAERRREHDIKESRELREVQQRSDAAREASLAMDREENRRRYEERLAMERAEARERHEQLMLMLSKQNKD
ncbi:hypothetical protein PF005_g20988 [Phytophthora fragariae]|uniref:DUF6818 domain-containing protein n=6 Tax=Phytophthora fragariae TaxID=53985 RepID=A0A6A3WJ98_9STRA|nr:hypothetical protein PF005_g20988 [Phytophthora fragariae]